MKFHRDFDLVAGQRNFFDAPDFHAGHFDAVANLQVLHGVEQRANAVAAVEGGQAAQCFNNEHGGHGHEDHENAQTGFE